MTAAEIWTLEASTDARSNQVLYPAPIKASSRPALNYAAAQGSLGIVFKRDGVVEVAKAYFVEDPLEAGCNRRLKRGQPGAYLQ
ncbi:MAG: hypothetical protein JF626_15340 [Polaromonas sp.]|nr:hypothetical protein [Polaromonas sp.]